MLWSVLPFTAANSADSTRPANPPGFTNSARSANSTNSTAPVHRLQVHLVCRAHQFHQPRLVRPADRVHQSRQVCRVGSLVDYPGG